MVDDVRLLASLDVIGIFNVYDLLEFMRIEEVLDICEPVTE